ncbi:hypothetical protein [Mammaliicoccus fleurettii]|uniref:hypothetical protein n=1 Tax=Mammaliicoccus fleurettii TaxID=150056 RepID=UPI0009928C33|nr:hypothetical protein [Mammaliicoccus fleurettii]OOV78855.1 hypothetical protein B2G86_00585 [Mammaliicoccus fleurettii]
MGEVIDYETSLMKRNLKGKLLSPHVKIIDNNTNVYGGDSMSEHIKREEYEQFRNHLDNKLDRVFDKMDENRKEIKEDIRHQNTITIAIISLVITIVGIIVPLLLH